VHLHTEKEVDGLYVGQILTIRTKSMSVHMNTHRSKHQQTLDHTIYRVPSSFDIAQQFQVGKLDDFIIVRPEPATMVSGVDYFLECLLPLIRRTHDADNSAGAFDRIALQAYVPGPYFVIQYVELFFVECKLGNFPSKQTAVVVVVSSSSSSSPSMLE
jgi:hypothetical protein